MYKIAKVETWSLVNAENLYNTVWNWYIAGSKDIRKAKKWYINLVLKESVRNKIWLQSWKEV